MLDIKALLHRIPVGIVLALELAIVNIVVNTTVAIAPSAAIDLGSDGKPSSSQVKKLQLAQSNPPPPPTNPDSSAAGGRRDPSACPQDVGTAPTTSLLTALSPTTQSGLTAAERPTFLVYVPKTTAENAEFSLRSQTGEGVYRTTIALTTTPNLISVTLPAQATPLEVGKPYIWSFAIICNPGDRLDDRFVTGTVQRIELEPDRLRQIQQAPLEEQAVICQKANVWYDALAILFKLKHSQPTDSGINTAWRELLQSGGIDTMIDSNLERENPH